MLRAQRWLVLSLGIAIGLFAFDFASRNRGAFSVSVPFGGTYWIPAGIGLLVAFACGLVLPFLISVPDNVRRYMESRQQTQRIATLEREVDKLRNLPLESSIKEPLKLPEPGQTTTNRRSL